MAKQVEAKKWPLYEILKAQRSAWSCAAFVALFLVWVGHVPVLPVLAGCLLGVAVSMLKSWPQSRPKSVVRGGR